MNWDTAGIKAIIRAGLREDRARTDVTNRLLIDPSIQIRAVIRAKQKGIIAGLPLAQRFLTEFDPSIRVKLSISDGAQVKPGQSLMTLSGKASSILSGERPALNALQHLSGIATFTNEQVKKLKSSKTVLCDTRKTLPGWRALQKYAVRCGGGTNHRMSLGDAVLIKENHLAVARASGKDWISGILKAKSKRPALLIQLEIQTEQDFRDALRLKPGRILLDNLPTSTLKRMMAALRMAIPGVEIEFTGGITPERLKGLARLGPDRISMGRLTHSVAAFDCSLDITHVDAH